MVKASRSNNRVVAFLLIAGFNLLALYLAITFQPKLSAWLEPRMGQHQDSVINALMLLLWATLAFLGVRAFNFLLFDFIFKLRRGYEAPTLVRNVFSIIAFIVLFVVIFNWTYPGVNLGALFTTSAIFGVIIGLALQDTLGNFFAGISRCREHNVAGGQAQNFSKKGHAGQ
ncbi:MAG: hypothetical protein AUG51_03530 [Acidobacteria bacterium 13_1_20CM_3_53_8]|nr:MAG: hypothetical protein AUG51_03530 [Acidobacteria bacterium 13_1_20CM_3_53_8]